MKAVIYARVSKGENASAQLHALEAFAQRRGWPVEGRFVDSVTGDELRRKREPRGLVAAMDAIRERRASVLVVFAADRLVRSPVGLLKLVARIQADGGNVASLQDGADLDTTTDVGELMTFIRGWWARMELRLIRQRTRAGIDAARARGVRLGRPPKVTPNALARAVALREGRSPGVGWGEVSRALQREGLGDFHRDTLRTAVERAADRERGKRVGVTGRV